jgi:hypothetical protein
MTRFLKISIIFLALIFSMSAYADNWKCINRAVGFCNTWRMQIPMGWLVASDNGATGGEHGYAMIYIPDPEHTWKE